MPVKTEIKQAIKEWSIAALVFGLFLLASSIAGNLEMEDEILQHSVNCNSATYAYDNPHNCTGE